VKFVTLFALLGLGGLYFTLDGSAAAGDGGDGLQTTYYPSGRLRAEYATKDGVRDGACRRWHPDGRLELEGGFLAGRMDGEWRVWDSAGELDPKRSGVYRDGERVGDVDPTPQ
jgi:antitoxin component YwqK of YwqJK toxin-antitoxin module